MRKKGCTIFIQYYIDNYGCAINIEVKNTTEMKGLMLRQKLLIIIMLYIPASFLSLVSCNSNPASPTHPQYPYEIIATVNIGPNTYGICCTPDGSMILITSNGLGDYLNFVDTDNYSVLASIPIGRHPRSVVISPDGAYAYCSNAGDATISVISVLDTMLISTIDVGGIPNGLAVSSSGEFLYAANYGNCAIDVINTEDYSIVEKIELRGSPTNLCLSHSGESMYAITTYPYPYIYAIRLSDHTLQDSISLNKPGLNVMVTPNDDYLYALSYYQLLIINTNTFTISNHYRIHAIDAGMTSLQSKGLAYVCGPLISGIQTEIWLFDLSQNTFAGKIEFPSVAKYMTSSPSGDRVYVSCNALVVLGN